MSRALWQKLGYTPATVALLDGAPDAIDRDGMIWVSWPKKSSGVGSDMSLGALQEAALPLGLVDVKVCAVDGVWTASKLVIRKEFR